ncbi:alpha-tubulin N-acetyltransferase 1 isoform X3 [Syngnathus typhle]|uniref:alpha-tubulin N-acetyltransferase 1 isoform X3 n=1 Tax=Syngnathus typhle TaxID=161592 RepID=UPI002A6B02E8|nr:alpha-tubulin N-acetyltransferase 1 isoform X3 [Syngnathus typhle]
MEFPFNVNQLFPERFSILDKSLVVEHASPKRADLQSHIATVVDKLGRASAKAQKLTTPVTSATKLQSQHHELYLMKDGESNGECGVIVGFLKVGYKKLILLDRRGLHTEAEPLCVLDFFIAENLQRHGYGLELFQFMLQHKNIDPVLMAYDRPSPKLLSFLAKHYCLTQSVPQVNNFVVFDGFFNDKSGSPSCPLTAQGMYGFFGQIKNDSPKKARQRDQALFHGGERSGASGREESSLAVGILPVLPQCGLLPYQGRARGTQGPEAKTSSRRTIPGETHQPTGSSCQRGSVQSPHGQPKTLSRSEVSQRASTLMAEVAQTTKPAPYTSNFICDRGQGRLLADLPRPPKTTPRNRC